MSVERRQATAFTKHHRDGTPWAKGRTLDGEPTGYWEWFRTDGTRMRSGYFEAGRQVGTWTTYDRHGTVYKVTDMNAGSAVKTSRTRAGAKKAAGRPAPRWKSEPAKTPAQYIAALPPDRKAVIKRLREVLLKNLPPGFEEIIEYGMIGYVVPLSLFPAGYLDDPRRPLPFIGLASQKQYVSLYHMGLYDGPLLSWFRARWPKHTGAKFDLGKVCLRLRNLDEIPYDLIGELARRMTPRRWIGVYEAARENR